MPQKLEYTASPGNPVMLTATETLQDGRITARGHWLWCPGCEQLHRPRSHHPDGESDDGPYWGWDGNEDRPTFEPSYITWEGPRGNPTYVCHSFIRNGQWQFLGDCTHGLRGQTVDLPPLPDWFVESGT